MTNTCRGFTKNGARRETMIRLRSSKSFKRHSDGSLGERLAEYKFKEFGWVMFRHQPATRVTKRGIINIGNGGVSDYTGFYHKACGCGDDCAAYISCEVKESCGVSMPASRLSTKQRAFMASLPPSCAWVCVVWTDRNPTAEIFPFKENGSYKRSV